MQREEFQTVKEVADLLKVSEAIVRRWIKGGELRAIDIGKGWRIGQRDLDAFLESHATQPCGAIEDDEDAKTDPSDDRERKERKT